MIYVILAPEWSETVKLGRNILAGTFEEKILDGIHWALKPGRTNQINETPYGDGQAAKVIASDLKERVASNRLVRDLIRK